MNEAKKTGLMKINKILLVSLLLLLAIAVGFFLLHKKMNNVDKLLKSSSYEDNMRALYLIQKDKSEAIKHLPEIINLLSPEYQTNIRVLSINIINSLGNDAKGALPKLVAMLQENDNQVRVNAIRAIGSFGAEAKDSVPALIVLCDDKKIGWHAMVALRNIGKEAQAALPYLEKYLSDSDPNRKYYADIAIKTIKGEVSLIVIKGESLQKVPATSDVQQPQPSDKAK